MTLDLPIPNNSNKQPSQELEKLLEELKNNFSNTKNIFERAVNKAKEEGFTDKEIDSLLYSKLKEVIPRKTLFRYREEFIPLAIDKRNNKDIEQCYGRSGSNDTTTNEIKFTSKDVTAEVMERLRLDSIMRKQRWDDEKRRNKILEQLPKDVVEYANKDGELSTNKLEMLLTKNIKQYPELQKHLIDKIKDTKRIMEEVKISDNKAKEIVEQTNRDIETGYLRPSETGKVFTYSGDPLKRDVIKGNKTEAKEPYDYYRDSHDVIKKLLYLLTGYKKDEHEYYTKDIINNTNNHRLYIVKSINSEFRELYGYDERFIKPLKMAIDDIHKKLNNEMDSAERKQEMIKE
jgi:hypothetical protein